MVVEVVALVSAILMLLSWASAQSALSNERQPCTPRGDGTFECPEHASQFDRALWGWTSTREGQTSQYFLAFFLVLVAVFSSASIVSKGLHASKLKRQTR